VNAAAAADVQRVIENVRAVNATAILVRAASPVGLDEPESVRDRRVLVVEDGPSITHGGMPYGAGYVAAIEGGAGEILDPRAVADPRIAAVYIQYPHIGAVLPAVGYGPEQLEALRRTIDASDAEVIVSATPCDLTALIALEKPVVRARYAFAEVGAPGLVDVVEAFLARPGPGA
jgi:predicted GTPase